MKLIGVIPSCRPELDLYSMTLVIMNGAWGGFRKSHNFNDLEKMFIHTLGHFTPKELPNTMAINGLLDLFVLKGMAKEQGVEIVDLNEILQWAYKVVVQSTWFDPHFGNVLAVHQLMGVDFEYPFEENITTPDWNITYTSTNHTFTLMVNEYVKVSTNLQFPKQLKPAFARIFANGNIRNEVVVA